MMHNNGISYEGDILDLAVAAKFVVRSGAWFRYGEMQLGQGREKTKDLLRDNPKLAEEFRQKILEMGSTVAVAGGGGADAAE